MSTITDIFSSTAARDASKPASSNTGLVVFRSDTKAIEVSDGTSYYKYNNDGTSSPATKFLVFDGTDKATIPDDTSLQVTGDLSICCWFNLDNTSGIQALVSKRDSGGTNYVLYVNYASGKLTSFDGISLINDTTALSTGTWYHGAVVIDSGTSTKFYINGSLSSTRASSTISANDADLLFGQDTFGSDFEGKLDDVVIYNRILSASEVADIKGGTFPASGLLGKWTIEGDTGTSITDSSSNTNNGTLSASGMIITGQR
jgi:hypothetical protein